MTFIRSTPERRAGVLQLKLMFDEAHRLREEDNIWGYAHQIAEIDLAYAKLNPKYADKLTQKEKSAAVTRSMGKKPDYPAPNWRKNNYNYLDKQLQLSAGILGHFENQLRIGFSTEMTCPPGLADYV